MKDNTNLETSLYDYIEKKIIKILVIIENNIGDKNNNNFCHQNIIYANKKYNMTYMNKQEIKYDNIYYHRKNHLQPDIAMK